MGVKADDFLGGFTPICDSCGIALCWGISEDEYLEAKGFWDTWKCQDCNPNYKGALQRWLAAQKQPKPLSDDPTEF